MATKGINGPAAVAVGVGVLLVWTGVRGYSLTKGLQNILKGIPAKTGQKSNPVGNTKVTSAQGGATLAGAGSAAIGAAASLPASSGGTISQTSAQLYWIAAGGPTDVAHVMSAIAVCESGLRPGAVQQGQPYATTGWGLWQITPGNSEPGIGVDKALLHPLTNARAAVAKYKSQGLGAWTTYTNGCYASHL